MSDEYDRRAEAWLKSRYPAADPDLGSVKFITDCAAYASGGWANIEVEWTESGSGHGEVLVEEAWQYDLTQIIRELLDIDLPARRTVAQLPGVASHANHADPTDG